MKLTTVLIALMVTLLGLIPLRQMYRWERAPMQFSLTYFTMQHFVYGFGGLLLAIGDRNYSYVNIQGYFFWTEGLPRLQIIHLISLCAGFIGVWIGGVNPRRSLGGSSPDAGQARQRLLWSAAPFLRRLCYLSLFAHAAVVILRWLNTYYGLGALGSYVVLTLSGIASVSFFFWGLWWRDAGKERIVIIAWLALFMIISMAAGGRGAAIYASLLFAYGIFLVATLGGWRLRLRHLVLGTVGMALIAWLMVVSADLRASYQNRKPANTREWVERITSLFQLKGDVGFDSAGGIVGTRVGPFERVTFHFAARIVDLSSLDVVARTPEQIPYWGWDDAEWSVLATHWLPAFFFSDLPTYEHLGPLYLRRYGWYIQFGEGGNGMPASMLADGWRRFGWLGVIGLHIGLAVLLTRLSLWSAARVVGRRFNLRWFVMSGGLLAVFAMSYALDPVTFLTALPRRFVLVFVYALALSAGCQWWVSKRRVTYTSSPRSMALSRNRMSAPV